MTNTSLLGGKDNPDDIIKSVKRGIYAKRFCGGQVNISNGDFVFSLSESYLIEDGKLTAPLKGVNLIGNGPDVLRRVDMLGRDFQLSRRHLDVRQGRPVRAGQRRHADGSHRVDHGRRHAGMSGAQVTEAHGQGAVRRRAARRRAREEGRRRRRRGARPRRQRADREGPPRRARARAGSGQPRARPARAARRPARRHVHERPAARSARGAVRGDASRSRELAEPDEYALPPDPALLAKHDPRARSLRPGASPRSTRRGRCARRRPARRRRARHDTRVTNSEGATWSRVLGATAFATSGGFVGGYRGSYASLVVEPLCDDTTDPENPKKRNGYWWTGVAVPRRARGRRGGRHRGRAPHARDARLAQGRDAGVPDRVRSRGRALDRRHDLLRRERLVVLAQVELPRRQGRAGDRVASSSRSSTIR